MTAGSTTQRNSEPDKTVVALATAPGSAALAVVQLAGPNAAEILRNYTDPPAPGQIKLTMLENVDQVLVTRLAIDADVYEITCHGGIRIVQRIIELFTSKGAQLTDASELTTRVHQLKTPLAVDAYALLPHARTTLAATFLLHQARLPVSRQTLTYWPAIQYLLHGATVAIVGPANAGKSTLLNYLVAHEQALVSDRPGTTRDYVQADVEIHGIPITFIDTAGVGYTDDALHDQAVEKTRQAARLSDMALIVLDASDPSSIDESRDIASMTKTGQGIVLLNKTDIHKTDTRQVDALVISALTGRNIAALEELIVKTLGLADFDPRKPTAFTQRHADYISSHQSS